MFNIYPTFISESLLQKLDTEIHFQLRVMRNVSHITSCVCFMINRSSKFDVYYSNIGNECENVQEKARAVHFDICTHILIASIATYLLDF